MPYSNTRELKEDVLFRAHEAIGGNSDWEVRAVEYLNRVYRTLCTGVSEFLPEYVDDWWWLRGEGVFLLEPVFRTGTVAVTEGGATATLSVSPAISLAGRRLLVEGEADVPYISAHTAATPNLTLDANWTGETNAAAAYKAMKVKYDLPAATQALISPMMVSGSPHRITGMTPEALDDRYPVGYLDSGIPAAFALIGDRNVVFSHGGDDMGDYHRVEFRYRPVVADLTDSTGSVPLVPLQWRHLLADMALVYVLLDKNDDRSNAVALGARTGLAAMLKDNRRRHVKIDKNVGHIYTRPLNRRMGFNRGLR